MNHVALLPMQLKCGAPAGERFYVDVHELCPAPDFHSKPVVYAPGEFLFVYEPVLLPKSCRAPIADFMLATGHGAWEAAGLGQPSTKVTGPQEHLGCQLQPRQLLMQQQAAQVQVDAWEPAVGSRAEAGRQSVSAAAVGSSISCSGAGRLQTVGLQISAHTSE